ncbi:MAG: PAS domain S-box protein [Candidatus Thorarchaeota archaeon]
MDIRRVLNRNDVPKDVKQVIAKYMADNLPKPGLETSRELTSVLIQAIPIGFAYHEVVYDDNFVATDYVFVEVNKEYERLTGLKREKILGKRATKVVPGIENDPIDWIGNYGRVASTGQVLYFQDYTQILQRWYTITAYSPERGYVAAVYVDSTERKEAEDALKKSEEDFRSLLETSSIGYGIIQDNRVIFANEAWARIGGYERNEVEGWTIKTLLVHIHPEDRELVSERLIRKQDGINKGMISAYPSRVLTKEGKVRWVDLISKTIDYGGKPAEFVSVIDITQRKKTEEALEFLYSLLKHDLSNKMHVIQGYLALLEQTELSETQSAYVKTAVRGCESGVKLLNKISNLRLIESGALERTEEIDLMELSQELLRIHSPRAIELGMEIDFEINQKIPPIWGGDLLMEVFSNLIENVFLHSGGTKLRITTVEKENHVDIVIDDDGKGISASLKKQLFNKGIKGPSSKGTGLGLFLVKTIIEAYGGTISVGNSHLGGSCFLVSLRK